MSKDERITRLEEELAFQEQKLDGLNEALLGQQKQINKLEVQQERLLAKIDALLDQLNNGANSPANEKPPHYL